jgi:predicted nucleic acid-binding Zn ribbon protein
MQPTGTLHGRLRFKSCKRIIRRGCKEERRMNGLIYLIGLIVVIMAILSFLGLR